MSDLLRGRVAGQLGQSLAGDVIDKDFYSFNVTACDDMSHVEAETGALCIGLSDQAVHRAARSFDRCEEQAKTPLDFWWKHQARCQFSARKSIALRHGCLLKKVVVAPVAWVFR